MTQKEELLAMANRLTEMALGESPAVQAELPVDTGGYPKLVVIQGAQFMAEAPINPNWQPSQYGKIWGKRMVLPEPTKAPAGFPLRSPAGFPLYYPSNGGSARVLFAEDTYANDTAVYAYVEAAKNSLEGGQRRDEEAGGAVWLSGEKP
jgi:hypothetical protein